MGTNDKLNVAYKKTHKKDLSENRTKNQQQNEIIPTENHNETNKKNIKDKETIKKTKISDDTENKSKSKTILKEKKNMENSITVKEKVEDKKKDELISDAMKNMETKNKVYKNEKDQINVEKNSESKGGEVDLKNYIDLHKKHELK